MTLLDTRVIIDFLAGDQKIVALMKEISKIRNPVIRVAANNDKIMRCRMAINNQQL